MHISISISKSISSNAIIFFLGDINILKIFLREVEHDFVNYHYAEV